VESKYDIRKTFGVGLESELKLSRSGVGVRNKRLRSSLILTETSVPIGNCFYCRFAKK